MPQNPLMARVASGRRWSGKTIGKNPVPCSLRDCSLRLGRGSWVEGEVRWQIGWVDLLYFPVAPWMGYPKMDGLETLSKWMILGYCTSKSIFGNTYFQRPNEQINSSFLPHLEDLRYSTECSQCKCVVKEAEHSTDPGLRGDFEQSTNGPGTESFLGICWGYKKLAMLFGNYFM